MNPNQLVQALYIIANRIDNSIRPSRSLLIRDLNRIIAAFPDIKDERDDKYDAEGNLISPPSFKPAPTPAPLDVPKKIHTPLLEGESGPKPIYDQETEDKLIAAGVISRKDDFRCSKCRKSFKYNPKKCTECEQRALNREIIGQEYDSRGNIVETKVFEYDPEDFPIVNVGPWKKDNPGEIVERFMDYLTQHKQGRFTQKELDLISHAVTGVHGSSEFNRNKSKLYKILKEGNFAPEGGMERPVEYTGLDTFAKSVTENGKDYYTEEQLNKLAEGMRLSNPTNLDHLKILADSIGVKVAEPAPPAKPSNKLTLNEMKSVKQEWDAYKKQLLIEILATKEFGQLKAGFKSGKVVRDDKFEQIRKKLDISENELENFIRNKRLTNVPGVDPIVKAWKDDIKKKLADKFFAGLPSSDRMHALEGAMAIADIDPDDLSAESLEAALEEAVTRPAKKAPAPAPIPATKPLDILTKLEQELKITEDELNNVLKDLDISAKDAEHIGFDEMVTLVSEHLYAK